MSQCRYCGKEGLYSDVFKGFMCKECHVKAGDLFNAGWREAPEPKYSLWKDTEENNLL